MKKILSFILINLLALSVAFSATINSKVGYDKLNWGSTIADAEKAGYKLTPMLSESDKQFLKNLYLTDVEAYSVESKEKIVSALQFHYYKGKLFAVAEMLTYTSLDQKKLEARYGNFSEKGIFLLGEQYLDAKLGSDGKVSYMSIAISKVGNYVSTLLHDWSVYKDISILGQSLSDSSSTSSSKKSSNSIVDELSDLAGKLLQEKDDGSKASYAFLPLTTDYSNTLVEDYITDALTEAMFNTGAVKIFERENLQAILDEQKFQASGLVNEETAKSIGMLAGVDFVCYGTLKDIGDAFTVNARVIDVETGEICAMSRTNVTKDDYLLQQPQSATSTTKTTPTAKTTTTTAAKKTTTSANNLWQVSSYRNEFDGFTSYTFTTKSTSGEMFVVNYKKCDIQMNSRVFAGVYWISSYRFNPGDDPCGTYDIKLDDGSIITKKLSDAWENNLDLSGKSYYYVAWIKNAGARWLLDLLTQNNMITLRRANVVRKFQTSGLLDKMAEVGITWEEIDAAMANEEF